MVSKLGFEIATHYFTNSISGKAFEDAIVIVPCACRVDSAQIESIDVIAKKKKFKLPPKSLCPSCKGKAKAYYKDPSTAKASKEFSNQMDLSRCPIPKDSFEYNIPEDNVWIFINRNNNGVIDICMFKPKEKTFSVSFRKSNEFEAYLLANNFIQTEREKRYGFYRSKCPEEALQLLILITTHNDFPEEKVRYMCSALEAACKNPSLNSTTSRYDRT